jgi:maltose alpha-D-glucosyltransferase/alpha-amylase
MGMKGIVAFLSGLALLTLSASAVAQPIPGQPGWLDTAVFYQIYPSSFQDSDGDGIGDIPGITSRLEYVRSMGVNAIWLNPIFWSSWKDGGYDVIDYYLCDPRFGTNDDVIAMIEKAHSFGLKVIFDLVAGHSSSESPWFKQAQQGKNLQYSDYYIFPTFKPTPDDASISRSFNYEQITNNNDAVTRQFSDIDAPRAPYYVRNAGAYQPALNYGYRNPNPDHPWEQAVDAPGPMAVRQEMKDIMAFWFEKGVDGFRVDMAFSNVKNDDADKTETIKVWQDINGWVRKNYPENVMIAEWFNPKQAIDGLFHLDFFCHSQKYNYSTLFFNLSRRDGSFQDCYFDKAGKGELKTWFDLYDYQYQAVKGRGYASLPTSNHDYQRPATIYRNSLDELKIVMTFFLTMPGAPFIYYGDEIGMKYFQDVKAVEGGGTRTGTRTPMQWDSSVDAGFSTAPESKLYVPLDPDVANRPTVEKQENDPNSLLNYTRALIKLRAASPALSNNGEWKMVSSLDQPYPMVYERWSSRERYWVVINPSGKTVSVTLPTESVKPEPVCGNYKKFSYKQTRKGDTIQISGVSSAILKF